MKKCKRIFLLGHPGSGKAFVAKKLAERLGWKFINADLGLESRIGLTINDIVGKGFNDFFECQCQFLQKIAEQENIVVTTDASVVCYEKLLEFLSSEFTVYLEASLPVQLERTSHQPESLLIMDQASLFKELHQSRDALYENIAKLKISSDNNKVEAHISEIIKFISVI